MVASRARALWRYPLNPHVCGVHRIACAVVPEEAMPEILFAKSSAQQQQDDAQTAAARPSTEVPQLKSVAQRIAELEAARKRLAAKKQSRSGSHSSSGDDANHDGAGVTATVQGEGGGAGEADLHDVAVVLMNEVAVVEAGEEQPLSPDGRVREAWLYGMTYHSLFPPFAGQALPAVRRLKATGSTPQLVQPSPNTPRQVAKVSGVTPSRRPSDVRNLTPVRWPHEQPRRHK